MYVRTQPGPGRSGAGAEQVGDTAAYCLPHTIASPE